MPCRNSPWAALLVIMCAFCNYKMNAFMMYVTAVMVMSAFLILRLNDGLNDDRVKVGIYSI